MWSSASLIPAWQSLGVSFLADERLCFWECIFLETDSLLEVSALEPLQGPRCLFTDFFFFFLNDVLHLWWVSHGWCVLKVWNSVLVPSSGFLAFIKLLCHFTKFKDVFFSHFGNRTLPVMKSVWLTHSEGIVHLGNTVCDTRGKIISVYEMEICSFISSWCFRDTWYYLCNTLIRWKFLEIEKFT